MSSNPLRGLFGRRPQSDRASQAQLAALTGAFFACEQRMAEIDPAVDAARAVAAGTDPTPDWNAIRDRYDEVISGYLRITAEGSPEATPAAVDECTRAFADLTDDFDRFASRHERSLQTGRAAIAGAAQADRDARTASANALTALEAAPTAFAGLASVRAAVDALTGSMAAFDATTALAMRRQAADAVVAAGRRVEHLLAQAPTLAAETDRTLRSLDTRGQAVQTRLAGVPAVMSQLLRDFSAECSNDLQSTPADVRADLDAAAAGLSRARDLLRDAPDQALDAADQARTRLTHADESLDRVFDRLTDLREVRADPAAVSGRVRFRVRDAQNFALNHGLIPDWGSVLDAQADRVDRAATALDRIHPDYWSYLTQLRAVDARVAEIVGRMRDQVAGR